MSSLPNSIYTGENRFKVFRASSMREGDMNKLGIGERTENNFRSSSSNELYERMNQYRPFGSKSKLTQIPEHRSSFIGKRIGELTKFSTPEHRKNLTEGNEQSTIKEDSPTDSDDKSTSHSSGEGFKIDKSRTRYQREDSIRIGTKLSLNEVIQNPIKRAIPGEILFQTDANYWVYDVVNSRIVYQERLHIKVTSDAVTLGMQTQDTVIHSIIIANFRRKRCLSSSDDYLEIMCKDFCSFNIHFENPEDRNKITELLQYMRSDVNRESTPLLSDIVSNKLKPYIYDPFEEMSRQGYNNKWNIWRVVEKSQRIVPYAASDEILEAVKLYRYRGQYPSYCWGCWDENSERYGAILLRCGRPSCMVNVDENSSFKSLSYSENNYSKQVMDMDYLDLISSAVNDHRLLTYKKKTRNSRTICVVDTSGTTSTIIIEAYKTWCRYKFRGCRADEIFKNFEAIWNTSLIYVTDWQDFDHVMSVRWPGLMMQYIGHAMYIVELLENGSQGGSVVCLENAGGLHDDTDHILACLTQIILDPYFRTIQGFVKLIFKDWIYYGIIPLNINQPWALFFFFINCVYELLQQLGSCFEFTEKLLGFIMDHIYTSRLPYLETPYGSQESHDFLTKILNEESSFVNLKYVPYDSTLRIHILSSACTYYEYMMRQNYSLNEIRLRVENQILKDSTNHLEFNSEPLFWMVNFERSPNILSLEVKNCYICTINDKLSRLYNITKLNLENNHLTTIPESITTLIKLKTLNLSYNRLSVIPPMSKLTLETLIIENNYLTDVEEISKITTLTSLSLKQNLLTSIILGSLKNMVYLCLSKNKLSFFPSSILMNLTHLQTLLIDHNEIIVLPNKFECSLHLTELDVSHNGVWCMPPSLFKCTTLTKLNISSNAFSYLPDDIQYLQNLKYLFCDNNKLTSLPLILPKLKVLEVLDVGFNLLTEVPLWFYRLNSIKKLVLEGNTIKKISSGISHMHSLTELNLANNLISILPLPLGTMTNTLEKLIVDGNPLKQDIPPQFLSNTKLLLNHLNEMLHESHNLYRIKLMVVGLENVGKTSLIQRLSNKWSSTENFTERDLKDKKDKDKEFKPPISTDGIDINTIYFLPNESKLVSRMATSKIGMVNKTTPGVQPHVKSGSKMQLMRISNLKPTTTKKIKGKQKITVNIWDFAGQDVYYATHQFFLTRWSVYLLVFDLRELCKWENISVPQQPKTEQSENAFASIDYWLQSIKARVKSPSIFLVGTHWDDSTIDRQQMQVNLERLWTKLTARYECWNLQIFAVSCVTGENINILRQNLQQVICNMPEIGHSLPFSHLFFESLLMEYKEDLPVPVITQNELLRIASVCSLSDDDIYQCTRILHDLGALLYFDKVPALRDLVILDPQWLFKMMATIFTTKNGWVKHGILESRVLIHIWRIYHVDIHKKLLQLLEKFEVAYPMEGNIDGLISVVKEECSETKLPFRMSQKQTEHMKIVDSYLIPSLMPKAKPIGLEKIWPPEPGPGVVHIDRSFHFSFIPAGLFSRLLSRLLLSTSSVVRIWGNGLIASVAMNGATSNICTMQEGQKLSIQTRNTDKRSSYAVFTALMDLVLKLCAEWRSLTFKRFSTPQEVPIETVEKLVYEDKADHIVHNGVKYVFEDLVPDMVVTNYRGPRVKYDDVKIIKKLGEGGFAVVYQGEIHGLPVAVKRIKFDFDSNEVKSQTTLENAILVGDCFRQEVFIQGNLKHPNILALQCICMRPLCIVFDMCEYGDLYKYLHRWDVHMTWPLRLRIALDVARGLKYLQDHKPPIIHVDFKSPNIMLRSINPEQVCAQISDFGHAKYLTRSLKVRMVDNPVWTAPEILKNLPYDHRSDTYAYGVICYEILTRDSYFGNSKFMVDIMEKIISGERPPIIKDCPPMFKDVTESCWRDLPHLRPSMDWVVEKIEKMIPNGDRYEEMYGKPFWENLQRKFKIKLSEEEEKARSIVSVVDKTQKVDDKTTDPSNADNTDADDRVTIEIILSNPVLYEEFLLWLSERYASDTLKLYKAIIDYKNQCEQQLPQQYLTARAKEICYQYLGFGKIPSISLDCLDTIEELKDKMGDLNLIGEKFKEIEIELKGILQERLDKFHKELNDQDPSRSPRSTSSKSSKNQRALTFRQDSAILSRQQTSDSKIRTGSLRVRTAPRNARPFDFLTPDFHRGSKHNIEDEYVTLIPKQEEDHNEIYETRYHLRGWRTKPDFAKRLPKLDISQDLNDYPLSDYFVDESLYYNFEIFLKNHSDSLPKPAHHYLYFYSDVEDFREAEYTSKAVLFECARTIAEMWISEKSPIYDKGQKEVFSSIEKQIQSGDIKKEMFDPLSRNVKSILLFKLREFRQWYINKRNRELKKKKKRVGKLSRMVPFQKKEFTTIRLEKLSFDDFLKSEIAQNEFREYLRDRNSEPWLDFYIEIQNFKNQSYKDSEDILACAMKLTSIFLVDSGNSKVHLKNPSLMDKLKAAMATESFTSVNMFDEMLVDVIVDLKRLIQDFCWSLKYKSISVGDFESLIKLYEDSEFFTAINNDPSLLGPFYFCHEVIEFRKIHNKNDIIRTALAIGEKYLAIQGSSGGGTTTYDVTVYILDESHIEHVKTRLRLGVYSHNMFDTLFEYVKRPVIMFYAYENARKKK